MATFYPSTPFPVQFINPDTGELLSGGVLRAYSAGTNTPAQMYRDNSGTTAGTSITLNAGGYPTASSNIIVIWLEDGIDYKFVLEDSLGAGKWSVDNIALGGASSLSAVAVCKTVADATAASGPLQTNGLRMTAAQVAAVANTGAKLSTTINNTTSRAGGADYEIKTLAQHRVDIDDAGWTPNGFGDHYLLGGTTFILVLQQSGSAINPLQYGAIPDYWLYNGSVNPSPTDNAPMIQAAIDSRLYSKVTLYADQNRAQTGYAISTPIYLDYANSLVGNDGDVAVVIIKTTNTLGAGSTTHFDTTVISYAVDAAIIRKAPNSSSALSQHLQNLELRSTQFSEYGVYSAFTSKCHDADLTIVGFNKGMWAYDQFLCTYENVWVRNDGYARAAYGFEWFKGTSCKMINCWAKFVERGYEMGQLHYSMVTAACDNFTVFAYNGGSSMTYLGCGTEEANLVEGGYVFGGGARQINISGGGILGGIACATETTNASFFNFNGSKVTIAGYRLNQLNATCATRMDLFSLQNDATVEFIGGITPAETSFRDLVTHTTSLSSLRMDWGNGKVVYTLDNERAVSGPGQYENGVFRLGEDAVVGRPLDDPAKNLASGLRVLINNYALTSTPRDILTIGNTSGAYNLVVDLRAVAISAVDSALIDGIIMHINGTGGTLTQAVRLGGAFTLSANWSGGTLQLGVDESSGANNGAVEVRVKVRESANSPRITWSA